MTHKGKLSKGGYRLDATGLWELHDPLSDAQLLNEGMPSDVRQRLGSIAGVILAGQPLSMTEREFIGRALLGISNGGDPAQALRLKERKNAPFKSVLDLLNLHHQIVDLRRQGASQQKALTLIASFKMSEDSPTTPVPNEVAAKADQLKKAYRAARPILKNLGKLHG